MILLVGGSGRLGTRVTWLLRARGLPVRILTRDPARASHLARPGIEIMRGDVRDPATVQVAVEGATAVVSAVQGLTVTDGGSPESIDMDGNRNVVHAARAAGIEHILLMSVVGASPDHPMELFRCKHAAEEELRSGPRDWTIVRATAFMETWSEILAEPLRRTGRPIVLGRGRNPINFVSVTDVARFVDLAVADPALRGTVLEIGGPENLTLDEFVGAVQASMGVDGRLVHVPVTGLRAAARVAGLVKPPVARQMRAAVAMDRADLAFDAAPARAAWPEIPMTRLADVLPYRGAAGRRRA